MRGVGEIRPPEKLTAAHDLSAFDCGEPVLNDWLCRRAIQNEATGASRTYVVSAGRRVLGYYTLAAGAIAHAKVPGRIKRNMPDPIPVMILGRLAVDRTLHGQGVGTGLLRDAVVRVFRAAEIAGIRAILVHAMSEAAKRFYEKHGFVASPVDPLTVMITIAEASKWVGPVA
jgi:GNAT superfamily N-acetyltransferase